MMKNVELYIIVFGLFLVTQFLTAKQSGILILETSNESFSYQDEFVAIETDEISDLVIKVVEKEYPGAGVAEAFKDSIGNYKLILVMDQDTKVVYLDTHGNWYNPERQG